MQYLSLTAADLDALVDIDHCTQQSPWTRHLFADSLDKDQHLAVKVDNQLAAYLIWRCLGDEAEILTLAVKPAYQSQGLARGLLSHCFKQLQAQAVTSVFLEVAVNNLPARRLYAAAGFCEVGRRKGYYPQEEGGSVDALVLKRALSA